MIRFPAGRMSTGKEPGTSFRRKMIILGVVLLITAVLAMVIGVVADLTRLNRTLAEEQLDLQKLQRYGD